jgi:Flp pilus assembly pilin Flp
MGVINKMKRLLRFLKDEEGFAEIAYGLIVALIAIVIIVAVATIVVKRLEKK